MRARFEESPRDFLFTVPGLYPLDKPSGRTSHDMVSKARKILGISKVGHAGTLDPLATGLLILMLGKATRLFDSFQQFSKTYTASVKLGVETDTLDITGTITRQAEVPEVHTASFDLLLREFIGQIEQIPPMYSSIKKNGQPLHKLARKGITIEREPRKVTVYNLNHSIAAENVPTEFVLKMEVSSGFYVRKLIEDIGKKMGCGAVMTDLRRNAIGPFSLSDTSELSKETLLK